MTWTMQPPPAAARDIAIGTDGSVWVVGTNAVPGGYGVWRLEGTTWREHDQGNGAVRISVDPHGMPWTVNDAHQIKKMTSNGWQVVPGDARDIAVGPDGEVWKVGTELVGSDYAVHRLGINGWEAADGSGMFIAVGPKGPWVVKSNHQVQERLDTNNWSTFPAPTAATDIAVCASGTVWVTGTDAGTYGFGIHFYTGSPGTWGYLSDGSQGVQIAVDDTGNPWVVNNRNEIWQGTNITPS